MSFQQIYDKLVSIEKKLESFEELKPMILSNDNLCGKCVGDLLCLTRQEILRKRSTARQVPNTENTSEGQLNSTETDAVENVPLTVEGGNIPAPEEGTSNEVNENDASPHDHNSEEVQTGIKRIVLRMANLQEEDSAKSLLHITQALNAKLYFEKARNSRRNLPDQVSTFHEIRRANFYEPSTSVHAHYSSSSINLLQDTTTAEEVFAIYPEFDSEDEDIIDSGSVQECFEFDEFDEDFSNNANLSDTLNSENSGEDDDENHNDTTIFFTDDDDFNDN